MSRFCTHCGAGIASDARFCTKCGHAVKPPLVPPPDAPAATPPHHAPEEQVRPPPPPAAPVAEPAGHRPNSPPTQNAPAPTPEGPRRKLIWIIPAALIVVALIALGVWRLGLFGLGSSESRFAPIVAQWLAQHRSRLMADACLGDLNYSAKTVVPNTLAQKEFLDDLVTAGLYAPPSIGRTALGVQWQYQQMPAAQSFIRNGQFCVATDIAISRVRTMDVSELVEGTLPAGVSIPSNWMPVQLSLRWVGLPDWATQGGMVAQAFPRLQKDLTQSVVLLKTTTGWALPNQLQQVTISDDLAVLRTLTGRNSPLASPSPLAGPTSTVQPAQRVPAVAVSPPGQHESAQPAQSRYAGSSQSPQRHVQTRASYAEQNAPLQCAQAAGAGLTNNTHGYIRITSGSGDFANINAANKMINVQAGSPISGAVFMTVVNHGAPSAVAPMIGTPSWGNPATSFWTVTPSVATGTSTIRSSVHLTAPTTPGIYSIIFAYQLEIGEDHIASGTNWATGTDIWGDGNDIAEFTTAQIAQAQQSGCTLDNWIVQGGRELLLVPADAISLKVIGLGTAVGNSTPVPHNFSTSGQSVTSALPQGVNYAVSSIFGYEDFWYAANDMQYDYGAPGAQYFIARHTIDNPSTSPANVALFAAADDNIAVWIDGQRVATVLGFQNIHSPPVTHIILMPGQNYIVVVAWNHGTDDEPYHPSVQGNPARAYIRLVNLSNQQTILSTTTPGWRLIPPVYGPWTPAGPNSEGPKYSSPGGTEQ